MTRTHVARSLIALSFASLTLVVPATTAGPLTDRGTQPGLTYEIESSGSCFWCHGDFSVENYEPSTTWQGSMMAQASRDPLFWAALDVANNDVPGSGDFCLRCHLPRGWLAGRSEPPGGTVDGCAMVGSIDEPDNDFDGVTCALCHRMMKNPSPPPGEPDAYYENGQFWIDDGECGGVPCRRGPYDYPADGEDFPFHPWAHSPYHESSENCGNCHDVTNPVRNLIDGGVDTGIPYPIERTYSEWSASAFAQPGAGHTTCQNCHMPDTNADPAPACDGTNNNHTGDLPMHILAGGNAWIPEVLRGEYPNLGLDQSLANTRDAAIDMLQNRSAELVLDGAELVVDGGSLAPQALVTNLTGHKLPTGYPEGRRMWLSVIARDGASNVLWESGAYDSATGILTNDAQIKIYEAKPGIWNYNGTGECDVVDGGGNAMFHFVLNDCWALDNRIPPRGFTGGTDPEMVPVGHTYPETAPGSGVLVHWDATDYAFALAPGTPSPVTVTATLRYQTSSKEYVEFLRDEAVTNNFPDDCNARTTGPPLMSRGELLYDMWQRYDRSAPVDMVQATLVAEIVVPTNCNQPIPPVAGLVAVKAAADVDLRWSAAPGAVEMSAYRVLSDASGANRNFIPVANGVTATVEPSVEGVNGCVAQPLLSCTDAAVVAAPPSLIFYQVVGVCDDGTEGEN